MVRNDDVDLVAISPRWPAAIAYGAGGLVLFVVAAFVLVANLRTLDGLLFGALYLVGAGASFDASRSAGLGASVLAPSPGRPVRRCLVAIACGVLGLLLLGWGLLFLGHGSADLLGWVIGISLIAAAVWLLRRPFAITNELGASTAARPVRPS